MKTFKKTMVLYLVSMASALAQTLSISGLENNGPQFAPGNGVYYQAAGQELWNRDGYELRKVSGQWRIRELGPPLVEIESAVATTTPWAANWGDAVVSIADPGSITGDSGGGSPQDPGSIGNGTVGATGPQIYLGTYPQILTEAQKATATANLGLVGDQRVLSSGGDLVISESGNYRLASDFDLLTISVDNVTLDGGGYTVTEMLVSSYNCSFENIEFGDPEVAPPATSVPTSGTGETMDDYVVWCQKPARFMACSFTGSLGSDGGEVGLLLGDQTDSSAVTNNRPGESARSITACRFLNCEVGLFLHSRMEYFTISGSTFSYNGVGVYNFGGNNKFTNNSVVYNNFGMSFGYPRTGGPRSYVWSGKLPAVATYANEVTANAYHSIVSSSLINHNQYGLHIWTPNSGNATSNTVFGTRIYTSEFQANSICDVRSSFNQNVYATSCYFRGRVEASGAADSRVYLQSCLMGPNSVIASLTGQVVVLSEMKVPTAANETSMILYDVNSGTSHTVEVGASDSGGAGFRALRIPN